jgi:hypothetical protein
MGTSARRCAAAQPWRRQRRTAAAGHCTLTLITRTRDPLERSISACEQISSSMSVTSISVVGRHCKVLGISPGQMRHAEPSLSSTRRLLSCFLICIADLPCDRSEPWTSQERRDAGHPGATTRATIGPKGGCADEFFRECRDRSAPLPGSSRILPNHPRRNRFSDLEQIRRHSRRNRCRYCHCSLDHPREELT